jgi:hypothetical protein
MLGLDRFFSFSIFYTVGRTPWTRDQPVKTSMPQVGFKPLIPVFEPAKRVHALDRVATVIGGYCASCTEMLGSYIRQFNYNFLVIFQNATLKERFKVNVTTLPSKQFPTFITDYIGIRISLSYSLQDVEKQ